MPKLKKSRRAEFLENLAGNIRICCKMRSSEKIACAMGISVVTLYSRIKNPEGIKAEELFGLSEYIGVEPEDLIKPLKFASGGVLS